MYSTLTGSPLSAQRCCCSALETLLLSPHALNQSPKTTASLVAFSVPYDTEDGGTLAPRRVATA